MDEQLIIQTITAIFNGSDSHRWEQVRNCFSGEVLLDYSSLSGEPASRIDADTIVQMWSGFLPKFTFTLHMMTSFEVKVSGSHAKAFCKGQAMHHLKDAVGGDLWTVYGTYDFELEKQNGSWKVSAMTFHLLYQEGNTRLPAMASI